jgi:hypothetical protein
MKSVFNDFSRFRNNQLKSYFRRKDNNLISQTNSFSASVFSGLSMAFLWSVRDHFPSLPVCLMDSWVFKMFLFPTLFVLCYAICYIFYFIILGRFFKFYEKLQNTFFLKKKNRTDEFYLETFQFEVVNQVSLALSIISHVKELENGLEESEKKRKNLENKFYIVEGFHHLNEAINILFHKIIKSKFITKINNVKYTKISKSRIYELKDLSLAIINQIDQFLVGNETKSYYSNEIQTLLNTISLIDKELQEN